MPIIEQLTADNVSVSPTASVADDAVGVPGAKLKWFVAIVTNRSEKRVAAMLDRLGVQNYVATQEQVRLRPSGRRVTVEQIVIPAKVFVRTTEAERRQLLQLPGINRYLSNHAAGRPESSVSSRSKGTGASPVAPPGKGTYIAASPVAIVPDAEIEILRFMLGQSDNPVTISDNRPFAVGEKVKVIRGQLQGLTGEISRIPAPTATLTVRIPILGYAQVTIDPTSLSHLPD